MWMLHLEHIHHFLRLCNKLLVYVSSPQLNRLSFGPEVIFLN